MAQIEASHVEAKANVPATIEFVDKAYTGKSVKMEINMKPHTFKSGKTGYVLYAGKCPVDPESKREFRLFNGMLGVYIPQSRSQVESTDEAI